MLLDCVGIAVGSPQIKRPHTYEALAVLKGFISPDTAPSLIATVAVYSDEEYLFSERPR
jgi:hypothetical protein